MSQRIDLKQYKCLAVGQSLTEDCPVCGRSKKFSVTRKADGIIYHCYSASCGTAGLYKLGRPSLKEASLVKKIILEPKEVCLPKDYTLEHPHEMKIKLLEFGLTSEDVIKYKVGYSEFIGCYVYPLYDTLHKDCPLVGIQFRSLEDRDDMPKYLTKGRKVPYICLNNKSRKLVLTEDVLSAIKVSKEANTLCLLGTELSTAHKKFIIDGNFDEVIVWFDNDKGGDIGVKKSVKFLEVAGVNYRVEKTAKDPKQAFYKDIKKIIGN